MPAQQVSTRESCGVGDRFDRETGAFQEFLRAGEPGRDEPGDGRLPGLGGETPRQGSRRQAGLAGHRGEGPVPRRSGEHRGLQPLKIARTRRSHGRDELCLCAPAVGRRHDGPGDPCGRRRAVPATDQFDE